MIENIIPILLLILAGVSKAIMDKLAIKNSWSWLNKKIAASTKPLWFDYKDVTWFRKYRKPYLKLIPKFPGSTTIFVFLTDAWHFFQFLFLNFLIIGTGWLALNINTQFESLFWTLLTTFILASIYLKVSFQVFYDKESILWIIRTPLLTLLTLLLSGGISSLLYYYIDNLYIENMIIYTWSVIGILGGLSAIIGFIYGIINIKK